MLILIGAMWFQHYRSVKVYQVVRKDGTPFGTLDNRDAIFLTRANAERYLYYHKLHKIEGGTHIKRLAIRDKP
jgi:hypothetical protein